MFNFETVGLEAGARDNWLSSELAAEQEQRELIATAADETSEGEDEEESGIGIIKENKYSRY